jgi:hypothetical protein
MSQRRFGEPSRRETTTSSDDGGRSEECGEAVIAAMQAIGEHCSDNEVPIQMSNGMVAMVPEQEAEMVKQTPEGKPSVEAVDEKLAESDWLDEWTERLCKTAGHTPGTDEYEQCRRRYAREALE